MAAMSYSVSKMLRKYRNINFAYRFYGSSSSKRGLVLGAFCEKGDDSVVFTDAAKKFDAQIGGKLTQQFSMGGALKPGKSRVFWDLHPQFPAVAVAGLGPRSAAYDEVEDIDEGRENVRVASAAGCKALREAGMTDISVEGLGAPQQAAEGAALGLYRYQDNKAEKNRKAPPSIQLYTEGKGSSKEWSEGLTLAGGQNLARTLMETPANLMTPTIFAECAVSELTPLGVKVVIRNQKWAEDMKMHSFLSVSRGSEEPPVFLEISYRKSGNKEGKPVVLVGKGVTFDSGGISIKPSANMAAMRGDMGGAACVIGAIKAIASLRLPVDVIGLIPLTENMPSGKATKPGDVVVAMNGKTILVDNTDAEGRLILADALCYSSSFNPRWTVDLATLTGAMRVALGGCAAGAFTRSSPLWMAAREAASATGDRLWRFPLWKHYITRVTEYPNVDVHNVGKGKGGGSCTAAAFLAQFAPESPWMHLDIASVMDETDDQPYLDKGMSGRPTRTLVELIKNKKLLAEK